MEIRCLIVDDEPLAREGLRVLLQEFDNIKLIGEAKNVQQALSIVLSESPDVIFLDIKMPGPDGFKLAKKFVMAPPPYIVFVTAYPEYALKGFEVAAEDYIVKPPSKARLKKALLRVQQQLELRRAAEDTKTKGEISSLNVLSLRDSGTTINIPQHEVICIEAAGDYMCISTANGTSVVRITMKALMRELSGTKFLRVHRSAIINCDHVVAYKAISNGRYHIELSQGLSVESSKTERKKLLSSLSAQYGDNALTPL